MADLLLRTLIGGLFVSSFAILADAVKPKSLAGLCLFGGGLTAVTGVPLTRIDTVRASAVYSSRFRRFFRPA